MELLSIRRVTFKLQKLLLLANVLSLLLVPALALLQKTMPTGIWTMEGHEKLSRAVMIGQTIFVPFCGLSLCALDCLYMGFCAEIVIQFRILSKHLQELKGDGNTVNEMEINRLNEIKSCVSHHRLILRFIKEFRQAFSLILLIEFVVDGPLICAELLATSESMWSRKGLTPEQALSYLDELEDLSESNSEHESESTSDSENEVYSRVLRKSSESNSTSEIQASDTTLENSLSVASCNYKTSHVKRSNSSDLTVTKNKPQKIPCHRNVQSKSNLIKKKKKRFLLEDTQACTSKDGTK
ncbi:hypothetical protein ILUMI_16757 [Ignelater luminosus]|uniref:Uncharacterized protein n=1 Tax=Ignelater luminosus TaxID=2038154 RepID=A0A8K0CSB1_IGNLU|nr:hypothetical protein ILUMI_16757 [Ignelater luminosus]